MDVLDLPSPETIGMRYPHQVSGGQLQRCHGWPWPWPAIPISSCFDEPTTALDVTTQIEVSGGDASEVIRRRGIPGGDLHQP